MITRTFILDRVSVENRLATVIGKKLRVLMRCYTIRDLIINDIDKSLTFKKSHKIGGLQMADPVEYKGRFTIEDNEDGKNVIFQLILD